MKKEVDFDDLYYKFDALYVRQKEVKRMLRLLRNTKVSNGNESVELSINNGLPITLERHDFLPLKASFKQVLADLEYKISSVLGDLNQAGLLEETHRRHYNDWEDDFVMKFKNTHDLIF